ncbi:MAG TPA: hypothetical protein VEC35_15070 [Noviherbaspirillum sp.]|nr:hypothetical protein [Noviherbaspirillum sp.]
MKTRPEPSNRQPETAEQEYLTISQRTLEACASHGDEHGSHIIGLIPMALITAFGNIASVFPRAS